MQTCAQSYKSLLETLHNICIYSNVFYVLAGLYALITFKSWYKLMGIFILVIATVSVIHHSNENLGINAKIWGQLDVILANTGALIAMIVLIYLLYQKRTHVGLAMGTIIIAFSAIIMYIFSEIEAGKVKISDPTKSWGGNIFTAEQDDYTDESRQAMYLCYHTIWHILSGLAALLWVLSVTVKK